MFIPLPGGKEIAREDGHRLIYYKWWRAGRVIGWTRQYRNGGALNWWELTDYGKPDNAIKVFPKLREKILQAAMGEL